ncbi:MAG: diguanylate cyclase, partial [Raoultibacter sp.]
MGTAGQKSSARRSFAIAVATFVLACAIAGALCFQYYNQLQATIQVESSSYLREVSARIGSNINRIIADNYSFLKTLSTGLIASKADSFPVVQALVDEQREYWDFQDIILIDQDGRAYNTDGSVIRLDHDPDFLEEVLGNHATISSAQTINNEERIMISMPLSGYSVDGISMIALAASYDLATFDQTLSMSAFGGNAFSCIFEVDGTTVVRSASEASFEIGHNVLTTISDSDEAVGGGVEDIKAAIAQNEVGEIRFTNKGIRYYAVYTPVAPKNWYLITFVPANSVNAKSDLLLNSTLLICGVITTVFAALVSFILFISARNRHRLERAAYVDEVTGGNTMARFYELARDSLDEAKGRRFALVYTNLEKFKVLNEQFGRRVCDELLVAFSKIIECGLREGEILGRLSADNFCLLIEYIDEVEMRERLIEWFEYAEDYIIVESPVWSLPTAEFGIYVIDDVEISFPQMIDRAKLALKES